jgi:hypothetical protein
MEVNGQLHVPHPFVAEEGIFGSVRMWWIGLRASGILSQIEPLFLFNLALAC